jgi:putative transposase
MVIGSLEMAIKKEHPNKGLIVQTNQGTQYTRHDFIQVLALNGFMRSKSIKGSPYDNALVESFFISFKREVLLKQRYKTKKEAKLEILNYL